MCDNRRVSGVDINPNLLRGELFFDYVKSVRGLDDQGDQNVKRPHARRRPKLHTCLGQPSVLLIVQQLPVHKRTAKFYRLERAVDLKTKRDF